MIHYFTSIYKKWCFFKAVGYVLKFVIFCQPEPPEILSEITEEPPEIVPAEPPEILSEITEEPPEIVPAEPPEIVPAEPPEIVPAEPPEILPTEIMEPLIPIESFFTLESQIINTVGITLIGILLAGLLKEPRDLFIKTYYHIVSQIYEILFSPITIQINKKNIGEAYVICIVVHMTRLTIIINNLCPRIFKIKNVLLKFAKQYKILTNKKSNIDKDSTNKKSNIDKDSTNKKSNIDKDSTDKKSNIDKDSTDKDSTGGVPTVVSNLSEAEVPPEGLVDESSDSSNSGDSVDLSEAEEVLSEAEESSDSSNSGVKINKLIKFVLYCYVFKEKVLILCVLNLTVYEIANSFEQTSKINITTIHKFDPFF